VVRLCRARQRVRQGRLLKCLPQADSSLRGPPARRCVPTLLQHRRDMRESVRDARRAAPRPRAGLGCDVRHVACGCRRSQRSRARPRTWDDGVDGTLLLIHLLSTCSSRCTTTPGGRGGRRCASVAPPVHVPSSVASLRRPNGAHDGVDDGAAVAPPGYRRGAEPRT
jgi:hypothetical protein